ncbi:MAG: thioredoxin [Bacteroidaceae bacterium]|nr:thioredoxin [Bacteroidaceae bacterium]
MITVCLSVGACGNGNVKNESKAEQQVKKDVVEVLYFHGKQRCTTCVAIEKNTRELVESTFANKLKNGELVFKSVDITEEETLADKYEVSWSSLIIVDYDKNGKEESANLTEFAFGNARTNPDNFKKGVAERINTMLNN